MLCESDSLRLDASAKTVEIDGIAVEVPFHIHWCESCGGEMALNEDLRFNVRAMRQTRKKHYGLLTGEQVRQVRKRLGLNQTQAAKLFGGGPVAFSKYENDEVTQSEAMDRLIWLVGAYPWLMIPLAERLNITLTETSSVVIETFRAKFRDEYFLLADMRNEATSNALKGFLEISTASNDQIYQSGPESRPTTCNVA